MNGSSIPYPLALTFFLLGGLGGLSSLAQGDLGEESLVFFFRFLRFIFL